ADGQTDDEQGQIAVGCGCHAEHVVQAHDQIGDQDGLDGAPQVGVAFDFFVAVILGQQLHTDVEQRNSADQFEIRQRQQLQCEDGEHDTQNDGGGAAVQHGQPFLFGWQGFGGQCDHHGVVAGEHDVDQDDVAQGGPEACGSQ